MVSDPARKFRIVADVVQAVSGGMETMDELKVALTRSGDLRKTEVESMVMLAREFGFIVEDEQHRLHPSGSGLAFERYIEAVNKRIATSQERIPETDRGTELKVCITVPPMWAKDIRRRFGDVLEDTMAAQRLVAEDAKTRLAIVTPYLDIGVLQVVLKDVYAKEAELTIVTSEQSLAKEYPTGENFKIKKLRALISSRFKSGRVIFLGDETSLVHAKVWCSDRRLLMTSANVKSNSTTDNLKMGILTDEPFLVATVQDFLDHLPNMEGMVCLLRLPL